MAPPYRNSGKAKKEEAPRPLIIIKRPKAAAEGHRNMAWKVAYADFVTAMMAFFLLLWLLSTSSKATLDGIAEYFTPTNGISQLHPIGVMDKGAGGQQNTKANSTPQPIPVTPSEGQTIPNPDEEAMYARGAEQISQAIAQDKALDEYRSNIDVGQTPEGLKIEIKDSDKYAMYQRGTANLTEHGQAVLAALAPLIKLMPNLISVTGYTDASLTEADAGRWRLSSGRASAAVDSLNRNGLEAQRTQKVVGSADTNLRDAVDPRSGKNRRVSVLLIKGSHILIPAAAVPDEAPAQ